MENTEELLWKQFRQSLQMAGDSGKDRKPGEDKMEDDVIRGMSQFGGGQWWTCKRSGCMVVVR